MKQTLFATLLSAAVLVTGCATKNYVRQNVQPVDAKVDKVTAQSDKQGTEIEQTQKDVQQNATKISAVDETATAADKRAGDAMNKANQADQKADQDAQQITAVRQSLQNTVANLDNYKVTDQTTLLFGLNQAKLTPEDKQKLDMLSASTGSLKRYFIAVEGYTDQTGAADYNLELSKRRADAVVQYLAGQKDVDFNHIHEIGLGDQKPADSDKGREARAKNRRVEVQIYSADEALSSASNASH